MMIHHRMTAYRTKKIDWENEHYLLTEIDCCIVLTTHSSYFHLNVLLNVEDNHTSFSFIPNVLRTVFKSNWARPSSCYSVALMTIKLSSTYYTHIFTSNIRFEWMGLVSFHFYTHMIFTQFDKKKKKKGCANQTGEKRERMCRSLNTIILYMNIIWNVRIYFFLCLYEIGTKAQ